MLVHKPPYIVKVNKIPFTNYEGFTFWPFIFITIDNRSLLEHEKIHIKQQEQGWLIGFYIKYIYYHFKYGYKKNPYEIEAYKHQDDWKKDENK